MQLIQIKFCPWDKAYDFSNANNLPLKKGDMVILETEVGTDIGTVIALKESTDEEKNKILKPVAKLADKDELSKAILKKDEKQEMVKYCRSLVKNHNLPMKVIDAHISYDDTRVKFAFIADGRVDFRELVKDLARHYQRSVILYQVGIRDEAKICGDVGRCGVRSMCCKSHLHDLGGISSEMAEIQQIAHRGSERLSGSCGRLMCCLRYENEGYAELAKDLPALGSIVKYEGVKAEVIGWHTLKKTVDLKVYPASKKDGVKTDNNGGYERVFDIPIDKIKK